MLIGRKCFLIAVFFLGFSVNASELDIPQENVFVPQLLASSSHLKFSGQQFIVSLDEIEFTVKSYDVRGLPNSLTPEIIEKFLNNGYFSVGKSGEDYTLTANFRLLGGMPPKSEKTLLEKATEGYGVGALIGMAAGGAIGAAVAVYGHTTAKEPASKK